MKDMEIKNVQERFNKAWICNECADKRNWIGPDHAITMTKGFCGHCDREDETFLIPTVDFNKNDGKEFMWD